MLAQIIKQAICKHLEDNAIIAESQQGFVKNRSCETNLVSSFDKGATLLEKGKAVG